MINTENRIPLAILVSLIVILTLLHYGTDPGIAYFHEIYKLLYYIPIILAGFYFGIKGGLIASIAVSVLYLPHVIFQWHGTHEDLVHRTLETVIYLAVGYIVGRLAESERSQKNRYEQAALKLEESYEKLKYQSEMISEIESQLRHSERLSVMGELAASLAHEVRNPLGSIKGTVEIFQDDYTKEDPNHRFLEILHKEVDRLNRVVENFLSLAQQKPAEISEINLNEEINSVVQIVSTKARKEKIIIESHLHNGQLSLHTDGNKFRQVMLNLLLNAMSATPEGGRIDIQSGIFSEDSLQYIELSISDTGCGIPEDKLQDIFKPFYTSRKDGTGLGLTITKRIIDENKWNLQIESQVNQGTKVTIKIPITESKHETE